jgi:hypothetical protein
MRQGDARIAIAIRTEEKETGEHRFRAIAGNRQPIGRTMGEALDAHTAEWGDSIPETVVLIQRFQPDSYFTQVQYDRMQALLASHTALTPPSRAPNASYVHTSSERATLVGRTPVGRATIKRLQMNRTQQVTARRRGIQLGLFPQPGAMYYVPFVPTSGLLPSLLCCRCTPALFLSPLCRTLVWSSP